MLSRNILQNVKVKLEAEISRDVEVDQATIKFLDNMGYCNPPTPQPHVQYAEKLVETQMGSTICIAS